MLRKETAVYRVLEEGGVQREGVTGEHQGFWKGKLGNLRED